MTVLTLTSNLFGAGCLNKVDMQAENFKNQARGSGAYGANRNDVHLTLTSDFDLKQKGV